MSHGSGLAPWLAGDEALLLVNCIVVKLLLGVAWGYCSMQCAL